MTLEQRRCPGVLCTPTSSSSSVTTSLHREKIAKLLLCSITAFPLKYKALRDDSLFVVTQHLVVLLEVSEILGGALSEKLD